MPATLPVSYTSVQLILQAVPEIGSISTVTSLVVAHYAGRAEAELNARVGLRYTLPLASCPPLLTALATDLACYYLLTRKPLVGNQTKGDAWFDKFKEARDTVKELVEGKIELLDADGSASYTARTDNNHFYSNTMGYLPTFFDGATGPEEFELDSDKTTDDLNDRDD